MKIGKEKILINIIVTDSKVNIACDYTGDVARELAYALIAMADDMGITTDEFFKYLKNSVKLHKEALK